MITYRYAGDRPYQPQPNLKERIILAILLALSIAFLLGLIDYLTS